MRIISGIKDRVYLLAVQAFLWRLNARKRSRVFFILAVSVVALYGIGFENIEPADAGFKSKLLKGLAGITAGIFAGKAIGGVAEDFVNGFVIFFATLTFSLVSTIVVAASILVNSLLVALVSFAKSLMETALSVSLTIPYTSGGVIDAVWPVMRDLANMSLILILVAIGIGTMLNLNNWNWRKLLPVFLVVALLINFTPFLAGIVIDITNITTRAFFDSAVNTGNTFLAVNPFMGPMLQTMLNFAEILGSALTGDIDLTGQLAVLVLAVVSMSFNLFLLFGFAIVAALLIARIFALWFLVIISPLAAVAYIMPKTKKYFNRWWNNFFRWSIIAIPLVFFLWVAGMFANNNICDLTYRSEIGEEIKIETRVDETATLNNNQAGLKEVLNPEVSPDGSIPEEFVKGGLFGDVVGVVNNASVICGATTMTFALGALYIGVWMSIHTSAEGAGFITSRAARIQKASINYAKRQGRLRVQAPVAGAMGRTVANYGSYVPLLGGAFRALGAAGIRAQRAAQKQESEGLKKKFSNFKAEDFKAMSSGVGTMGTMERTVFQNAWDKKDKEGAAEFFSKDNAKPLIRAMQISAKQNPDIRDALKDFFKHNPHLTEDIAKAVSKLTQKDLENLTTEALKQGEVLRAMQSQNKETHELMRKWEENPDKARAYDESFKRIIYEELEKNDITFGPKGTAAYTKPNYSDDDAVKDYFQLKKEGKIRSGGSESQNNIQNLPFFAARFKTVPRKSERERIKDDMRQMMKEEKEEEKEREEESQ